MNTGKILVILGVAICLAGCATTPPAPAPTAAIESERKSDGPSNTIAKRAEGSLWSEIEAVSLYPDRRAGRIGDIVKVRIVEDPEAELNANTQTSRSSSVDAAQLKFLGYMKALADSNSRLAQDPGSDDLILSKLGTTFDGSGTSDRDGHVKAYVAAVVEQVFPNGNLLISGRREIQVNHETQYVAISGVIRAEDIDQYNEISSSYVANAKITYSGAGPIADKQKPGWLMRTLEHVCPF